MVYIGIEPSTLTLLVPYSNGWPNPSGKNHEETRMMCITKKKKKIEKTGADHIIFWNIRNRGVLHGRLKER